MHWRKGTRIVPLQAAKKVTGSFLPYNKADGMDNSSDSTNPSFCHGGIHRRWMILPLPTCLVILLGFSFISPPCYCSPLWSTLADVLSLLPPFLTSGHQITSCGWAWFVYSLPEIQLSHLMPFKFSSCTPEHNAILETPNFASAEWKREWEVTSSHLPPAQNAT